MVGTPQPIITAIFISSTYKISSMAKGLSATWAYIRVPAQPVLLLELELWLLLPLLYQQGLLNLGRISASFMFPTPPMWVREE